MFKDNLKRLRKERGLTQAELAKELNVSLATIGNYETGTRQPKNKDMWNKIADYFQVSVSELMDELKENPNDINNKIILKVYRRNIMSHQELMIESDLLQGNINRMCVTKDLDELKSMYEFALYRLEKIYDWKQHKLKENPAEPREWIYDKDPEPFKYVEILLDDGSVVVDMKIKGKYGNLEWRTYVDRHVRAWRDR